jgi:hypothetical protein
MSAKLLRQRPPPRAVAHRRCAPTHRAALSPETAARLDALLATADAPGAPPAAVDAAEADAVALLRKAVEAGDVRGFGRAARVPRRQYTLADLRLNKIDPPAVLSPTDATLNGVRDKLTLFAGAGAVAWGAGTRPSAGAALAAVVAALFAATADAVAGGAASALLLDTAARWLSPTYAARVAGHEAGHFLIGERKKGKGRRRPLCFARRNLIHPVLPFQPTWPASRPKGTIFPLWARTQPRGSSTCKPAPASATPSFAPPSRPAR